MMRIAVLAVVVLWLAGCASTPVPESGRNTEAAMLNVQLGTGYMQRGDLEVAKRKLERALGQDPRLAAAHHAYALLLERLGEPGKAGEAFRRALELDPDAPKLHNNYGGFLCRQGKRDAAEKQFLAAAGNPLYKTPQNALVNAGICVLEDGRKADAREYFERALEADPRHPGALFRLARLTAEAGEHERTRALLRRFHEVRGHTPESLAMAIRAERAMGNTSAVESLILLLRGKFPGSPQAEQFKETAGAVRDEP